MFSPTGVEVFDRFLTTSSTLHAPELIDLEIAQVLRRSTANGTLEPRRAELAFSDLTTLAIVRYPHHPLLPKIWQLRHNVTAYDAAYVALAEVLDATLVTCDARLASTPSLSIDIELV